MNNLMNDSISNQFQIDKIKNLVLSEQILNFTYFRVFKKSTFNIITSLEEKELLNLISGNILQQLSHNRNVAHYMIDGLSILLFAKRCDKVHFITVITLKPGIYETLDDTAKSALIGICFSAIRLMHTTFRFKNDIEDEQLFSKLWHPVTSYSSNYISKLNLNKKEVSLLVAIAASASSKELSLITGYSHHYLNKMSSELSQKLGCMTKFELQEIARIVALSQFFDIG
ncbi:hypothetical protein L3V82_04005 [Thiotrichales bacterium 19S3-7]|nr:hypothetical protein [Thiotrichales bacterium 19S3-7]MCF6801838.1 hypothetical protein [Thiotrichales bacterium 19S3-11]